MTAGVCASLRWWSPLLAVWGIEGQRDAVNRRRLRARRADARCRSARRWRRSGPSRRRAASRLRLRLDARLQRAGPDPRALRRHRLRLHAGRSRPSLSGVQHGGVLVGMLLRGSAGQRHRRPHSGLAATLDDRRLHRLGARAARPCAAAGSSGRPGRCARTCSCSASPTARSAVAAIGSMMALAGAGHRRRGEGMRMGLWGAAQAIAFGLGGFARHASPVDLARWLHRRAGRRLRHGVRAARRVLFVVAAATCRARSRVPAARAEQRHRRSLPGLVTALARR